MSLIATLRSNAAPWDFARALGAGEVHLWRFPCDTEIAKREHARLGDCVSAIEKQRAARFKIAGLREAFLLQHGVMRRLLSLYVNEDPAALKFSFYARGKPVLLEHPALQFNLAHAKDSALLAVAHNLEVGVDIEQLRDDLRPDELGAIVCAPDELAWVKAHPIHDQRRAFLRIWCRKEAALKAVGVGLIDRLPSLSVLGESATVIAAMNPCFEMLDKSTIYLRDLDVGEQHAAALATSAPIAELALHSADLVP